MWIETIEEAALFEAMPSLNDGDIKRIDARIAAATALLQDKVVAEVARLRPRGWKKALHLLREWSILGVTATIIVALLALALTQWNAANGRVAAEASFRTHTEDRLTAIETSLLAMRVKIASSSPADPDSQADVKSALADAKKASIQLPVSLVEEAGKRFIDASATSPEAWETALSFVSYRSGLIPPPSQPSEHINPELGFGTVYQLEPLQSKPWIGYVVETSVPQDQAARVEQLSNPPMQPKKNGIATFVMIGGRISLDDFHLRHVILKDVEVHYAGGATLLEDAIFINCRFVMGNLPNARQLATAILGPTPVTITAS
jgi:hypothetical protein